MARLATIAFVGTIGCLTHACSGSTAPPDAALSDAALGDAAVATDSPPVTDAGSLPRTLGPSERPAVLVIPPAHDGTTRLPIVFLLHGYGASASVQDLYFGATSTARARGYYLVLPNGTVDASGKRFWNATPACCNFDGSTVDAVAYLTALLEEAERLLPVDTTRVYFYGHSNGGYMCYRMACALSDRITAIASLAGADFIGEMDCVPHRPVSVLQVHGTADTDVLYAGDALSLGARADVVRWARRAGCDTTMSTMGTPLDLDLTLPGAETTVEQFRTGCSAGVDAELWSIVGGPHVPALQRSWRDAVYDWLSSHHRN